MQDARAASEHEGTNPDAEPVPTSNRQAREPLSRTLWGLDWSEHLPLEMPGGVVVHASNYDRALPFIRDHYAAIFQEDAQSPFSSSRVSPLKERYYRTAGDFFEFKRQERTVGLLVCTPVDWSTYYIRSAASLPEERGTHMVQGFLPWLFRYLQTFGVERIEADASPGNNPSLYALTRIGFVVSGMTLSERWGALTRMSLILDGASNEVFVRQFCHGVRHRRQDWSTLSPGLNGLERSAS